MSTEFINKEVIIQGLAINLLGTLTTPAVDGRISQVRVDYGSQNVRPSNQKETLIGTKG